MKLALDTSVILSHLKGDELAKPTRDFLRNAKGTHDLLISDVVYAELYAGIYLSLNPPEEETRVQAFLGVNKIEVKLSGTVTAAKRAARMYATFLGTERKGRTRILPDFLIGAHAEAYSEAFVTWDKTGFETYLTIPVLTPSEARTKFR